MIRRERKFHFLYSTAEDYPSYRVDLTELFSQGIANQGHYIDWYMRTLSPDRGRVVKLNKQERLISTRRFEPASVGRYGNSLLAVWHDIRLLWIPFNARYDFVQVRDKVFGGMMALVGARLARTQFYYWMSFPFPEASLFRATDATLGLSRMKRLLLWLNGVVSSYFLYSILLPHADHVFVQSDRMKADVVSRGVKSEKLTPVPMGIAWSRLVSNEIVPASDEWLDGLVPVVYVGTLVRARRMDFLIEVFANVRRERPDAILVLIGDASTTDLEFLTGAVERFGLRENVRFLGFKPTQEAWRYVKAARVCVSPIRPSPMLDPGSPTKVIEYLALGKAVVANEQPDQARVLRESGAGLVVPFEVEPFARSILELINDPKKAEQMGSRGPEYVFKNRSYERLIPELESVYQQLLGWREVETGV